MAKELIEVLVYRVGVSQPERQLIPPTLEAQQKIVGGYIEGVSLAPGLMLICNEEGKLTGLPPNRRIGNDIIAGDFFICRVDEEGDSTSVRDSDTAYLKRYNL